MILVEVLASKDPDPFFFWIRIRVAEKSTTLINIDTKMDSKQ